MLHDVRSAFRSLARSPGFAAVAVLSLALGIGANTAVFSLLHQVLLRVLPIQDPERVAVLHFEGVEQGGSSSDNSESVFSYPLYLEIRNRNRVLAGLAARSSASVTVLAGGEAVQAQAEIVSGNFFEVLGVRPLLGRLLSAADDLTPGGHPVTVLSHAYWSRQFGGSSGILNQSLLVNGQPMTVVGVAPRAFRGVVAGQTPDLFVPIAMKAQITPGRSELASWRSRWLNLFVRLKPGMSLSQA